MKAPKLAKLREKLVDAQQAVFEELKRLYPIRSRVTFFIMYGQKTPSTGTVVGWNGGEWAYVMVKLDSRTHPYIKVSSDAILTVEQEEPIYGPGKRRLSVRDDGGLIR